MHDNEDAGNVSWMNSKKFKRIFTCQNINRSNIVRCLYSFLSTLSQGIGGNGNAIRVSKLNILLVWLPDNEPFPKFGELHRS